MARLQKVVTQPMSWVTSTILGGVDQLLDPAPALVPEGLVAGREDLVDEEHIGVDRGRDREAEPRPHADSTS
jgi:hypothetical protein